MTSVTIGMDLGDKNHEVCVLNQKGHVVDRVSVRNTRKQLQKTFPPYAGAVVAMETGTHSPCVTVRESMIVQGGSSRTWCISIGR